LPGKVHDAERRCPRERSVPGPRLVHTPSEPSGSQRSPAVSSSRSFAQVAGAILQKQDRGQNPDKDEIPGFKSWRTAEQGDQVHMHVGARRSDPPTSAEQADGGPSAGRQRPRPSKAHARAPD
jgi:hypothetical protein